MAIIHHITTRADWETARAVGRYRGDTLETEGFIHCSTREQVAGVAESRFAHRTGLVLLCIDEALVSVPIRYENLEGGDTPYPHLYGPLDLAAVVSVLDYAPGDDGRFPSR